MLLPKLNPVEPPWYGPVCPVVWEGWHREVSPYPDHRRVCVIAVQYASVRLLKVKRALKAADRNYSSCPDWASGP
jgi:hypothetical protein